MTGTTSDTVFADLVAKGVDGFDRPGGVPVGAAERDRPVTGPTGRTEGEPPGRLTAGTSTPRPARACRGPSTRRSTTGASPCWRTRWRSVRSRSGTRPAEHGTGPSTSGSPAGRCSTATSSTATGVLHRPCAGRVVARGCRLRPRRVGERLHRDERVGDDVHAPHDSAGIVDLHGGPTAFDAAFDRFTERRETGRTDRSGSYGFAIHEMTEARDVRMGMLGLSNQPAHHIPFLPMATGRHDDAHRIVRECLDRLFVGSDLGQGYPGDEDNGEMSAWYVFATIGLYPLAPSTGTYVLVPPAVRRTVLRRPGGSPTVIETAGTGRSSRPSRSTTSRGCPSASARGRRRCVADRRRAVGDPGRLGGGHPADLGVRAARVPRHPGRRAAGGGPHR